METIAYALREEFEGTVEQELEDGTVVEVDKFLGGLINVGNGDLDVKLALEEGGGEIVVDERDAQIVMALNGYPALKRVGSDAEVTIDPDVVLYHDRKRDELAGDAKARGLEGVTGALKDDLVYALEEHDLRLAEGSLDELGAPLTIEKLAAARSEREEA